jgi:hypothetical protein
MLGADAAQSHDRTVGRGERGDPDVVVAVYGRGPRPWKADRGCPSLQFSLRVVQTSRLLVGRGGATLRAMDHTRNDLMKTANFVALVVGLLLTAAEFLVLDYDARQRVALYQAEVTTALAARR